MIDMYVLMAVVVQVMVFFGFTVSSETRCPVTSPLQRVHDFSDYFLMQFVFCRG